MKSVKKFSPSLETLLLDSGASEERVILVLQYVTEIRELLEERKKNGETVFWKDLPWVIQFWPVISFFYEDRDLINFLNPCSEVGGMSGLIGYSKKTLHDTFPQKHLPQTLSFPQKESVKVTLQKMKEQKISFPVFCKPDVGERAAGVKRVSSEEELKFYLKEFPAKKGLIIQMPAGAHFSAQLEYGVQLVRDPKTETLHITSAEFKKVPFVIGDGKKSITELVKGLSGITAVQRDNILGDLSSGEGVVVPQEGERVSVVHAASVSRGTEMVSLRKDFSGSLLEKALSEVLSSLKNFSSGRFDLVAASEEDLFHGRFEIIEGNAGAAIPLHVYRTDFSIEKVYQELFTHFFRLTENAKKNREKFQRGELKHFSPLTTVQIAWQLSKSLLQQRAQLKALSSPETQKMFLRIRKNARPERWELLKSRSHEKMKTVLGKFLDRGN
jgi:hypothetical protein